MNSGNIATCDTHRLLLNLADKIDVKQSDKYVVLSSLSIYYTWKNIKSHKINEFKISVPHGMKNSNYLMDHILYQIFKTIVGISPKIMKNLLIILQ